MIKTILARLTDLKAAGVHLGMDPRNGLAEALLDGKLRAAKGPRQNGQASP